MSAWNIREAQPEDCSQFLALITEMAEFEKLSHMVTMTENQLREDCFGAEPFFKCLVAEVAARPSEADADAADTARGESRLVGYAVYFYTYSTFEGRSVYLEDLYVKSDYRSKGIGTAMWKRVAEIAVAKGCKRLDFIALSWNEKAIALYERRGAENITTRDKWNLFRLEGAALRDFASS